MNLDLPLRTLGRAPAPPSVDIIGVVEEADLALLQAEGRPAGQPVRITELRDRHHSVARLLAAGHKPWEVCAITGYSASHLSVLQGDPTFQELLAFYRSNADVGTADLAGRVRDAAATAVAKVVERLESDEVVEFADLSKATKDLLDRAGYGPKSTKDVNINIGLAERLDAARQRALMARQVPGHEVPQQPLLELEAAE